MKVILLNWCSPQFSGMFDQPSAPVLCEFWITLFLVYLHVVVNKRFASSAYVTHLLISMLHYKLLISGMMPCCEERLVFRDTRKCEGPSLINFKCSHCSFYQALQSCAYSLTNSTAPLKM